MQLVKPMYYKLLTVSKQIPDCPLEVGPGTPISKVGDQCYPMPKLKSKKVFCKFHSWPSPNYNKSVMVR